MFILDRSAEQVFRPHIRALERRLPSLAGEPVRIQCVPALSDRHGAVHAGTFIRERRIAIEEALSRQPADFARIFVHELFHFAWARLGNPVRWSYQELVAGETAAGELGWSAQWRKEALTPADRTERTRRWREYVCESFCDTAAWMFSGVARHREFTLPADWRKRRRRWFIASGAARRISL